MIEPFSPKHNVIVGRNGSGKSNFFAAIRFVLSDAYTQMGREERQALLHEGSGSAVMSAYVEIIFDNTDGRFPTGKDELILRRTIGLKKDEYSLDHKNATKADVMNLLESAGFSRSNPYYIVPQGRVTALTNMRDSERLVLLKEVAGTQVYEARRMESLRIMNETNNKRTKIDELLEYIGERLDELEEEKNELRDFEVKDSERKALEYTLFHTEQQKVNAELASIEDMRQNGLDSSDEQREKFLEAEQTLANTNVQIAELKQQMEFLKVDRAQLEMERKEAAKARAQIELEVKNLVDNQAAAEQAKARQELDLRKVAAAIKERESLLDDLLPEYKKHCAEEAQAKAALDEAETARQRLYSKQGRNSRFKSKNERDQWLRNQIDDTNTSLSTIKAVNMQNAEDIQELENEISEVNTEIESLREQLEGRSDRMQGIDESIQQAKESRDKLMDQRKELWREEARLDSVLSNAQSELEKAERSLSHMMDSTTSRGLASVRRIKRQLKLDGVYGTLAELIDVPERYRTAVEVTAGNSLFHYVVDNDETATKLLKELAAQKAGRVTIMPLNRLKPNVPTIPKANDVIPMIERIKYDKLHEKAVQQVFGKSIICPNLTTAAQYARSHNLSAVTPEGDRSDKKGALTGGFHDSRSSRLQGVRNVQRWRDDLEDKQSRAAEIRDQLVLLDQQITKFVGEVQKLEQRKQQTNGNQGPLRQELKSKLELSRKQKDTLEEKLRSKARVDANVRELSAQQNAHQTELGTEFKKTLTDAEEKQLEHLTASMQGLRAEYSKCSKLRSELESRKKILEVELNDNYRPLLEQLENDRADDAATGDSGTLKDRQRHLKRMTSTLSDLDSRLQEIEASLDKDTSNVAELEAETADIRREQEERAKNIERQQRRMAKSGQMKAVLQARARELTNDTIHLGPVNQELLSKFKQMSSENVAKRLHKTREALKKYSHVNKKALEQYSSFTKQKEQLVDRREELDASQKSIEDLIEVLDQRKDEAIERTFKQVSREFAIIFEKLVPAGKGRLIIQRKADRRAGDELEDEEEDVPGRKKDSGVENYTGVGIAVSFNSKHDDQQRIQQLSGGQKSLCALTLIFAIQACDPAPFYLFDEIDANLDAQYRTAVAQHLHSLSQKAALSSTQRTQNNDDDDDEQQNETPTSGQFICTTFRPEMVLVAEKCYGVSFEKKASTIDVVSRSEALKFVEGQTKQ